jgi:hypothetical protein
MSFDFHLTNVIWYLVCWNSLVQAHTDGLVTIDLSDGGVKNCSFCPSVITSQLNVKFKKLFIFLHIQWILRTSREGFDWFLSGRMRTNAYA